MLIFPVILGLILSCFADDSKLNYEEYMLLKNIYDSANGQFWSWHTDGIVTNSVPWNFSDYDTINPCVQPWQGAICLPGNCPPTGCNLIAIQLTGFNLSGTLPDFVGEFPQLQSLKFGENNLHGSLPQLTGYFPALVVFNVSYNNFGGTIPNVFNNTPLLQTLYLSSNQLVGTIPSSIFGLSELLYLNLHENQLSDSLSANFANLSKLTYFHAGKNLIHGTIPPEIFQLVNISYLYLSYNEIHSQIPSISAPNMRIIRMSNNHLTGKLPSTLCTPLLEQISIYSNYLSGSIPECLSGLPHLELLQVQNNLLNGPVQHVFNSSAQVNLTVVDISDNAITGTLPAELFELRRLVNLAAGKNCFHGRFPDSICRASKHLSKLSLDGLAASNLCSHQVFDPFGWFNSRFGGLMQGTVPNCLWTLPALEVVHLSGNGFVGKLPDFQSGAFSISPYLKDVVLTHNRLTGTIPLVFQRFPFDTVDLSYNKLKGSIEHMTNISFAYARNSSGSTVHLSNNRLTGRVPMQYKDAYQIEILTGNLFSCATSGNEFNKNAELVKHDPGNQNAICGSQELDGAMTTFSILLSAVGCFIIGLVLFRYRKDTSLSSRAKCIYQVLTYVPAYLSKLPVYSDENYSQHINIYRLLSVLTLIRRLSWLIAALVLVLLLPIYVMFYSLQNGAYSTHTDQYTWVTSAVFLTGQTPAIVLMVVWSVLIILVLCVVRKHYESFGVSLHGINKYENVAGGTDSEKLADDAVSQQSPFSNFMTVHLNPDVADVGGYSSNGERSSSFQSYSRLSRLCSCQDMALFAFHVAIFFANFVVVIGMNAAYLFIQNAQDISSESKIAVQLLMAVFKLFWNVFMLRSLMTLLPQEKHSFKLHVAMLTFNSILAPCIATAFTDSSCFRECFVASSSITSSYEVSGCTETYQDFIVDDQGGERYVYICSHLETNEFTNVFTPSFIYYFTCGSKLLTAYTPVFVYTYTILLFLLPLFYGALALLPRHRLPMWALVSVDGVLRPQDRGEVLFRKLMRSHAMQAVMINHLVVLLTFGVCAPLLAMVMCMSLSVTTLMWQMLMVRYVQYETPSSPFSGVHAMADRQELMLSSDVPEERKEGKSSHVSHKANRICSIDRHHVNGEAHGSLVNMHSVDLLDSLISRSDDSSMQPLKESMRLYELNEECGHAWQGLKKAKWVVVYVSVFFYVCIAFDMAGDSGGPLGALWVIVYGLALVFFLRNYGLRVLGFCL